MRSTPHLLLFAVLAAVPLSAQPYQKHHLNVGLGVGIPGDELSSAYKNGFSWAFGYGYRPIRYAQLDIGLDTVYNAADVNEFFLDPAFGYVRIRDFEFLLPMGGRVVLPVGRKFEVYGGGGGAYMRYSERVRQPSQFFNVACPFCGVRDGWGYYAQVGGDMALTYGGGVRLGVATRMYRGKTDGREVGGAPAEQTRDRWLNTYIYLSFRF